MTYLRVLVPSRGRPQAAAQLAEAFWNTCTAADEYMHTTALTFVVDADDPALRTYQLIVETIRQRRVEEYSFGGPIAKPEVDVHVSMPESGGMVCALNEAAGWFASEESLQPPAALAFLGDDHRPRTIGWDQAYLDALADLGTGIVYGDDRIHGPNLPTQAAMTADIVRKLGFMALPDLRHLYVDNFWLELGRSAECIRYLPDVVVEHMHPVAGKAEWDDGYIRVNGPAITQQDAMAWQRYRESPNFFRDVDAVRSLREKGKTQ